MEASSTIRGERFNIDIGDSVGDDVRTASPSVVKDVLERPPVQNAEAPSVRMASVQSGGFPAHKSRHNTSRFRAQRAKEQGITRESPAEPLSTVQDQLLQASIDEPDSNDEHVAIDRENRRRLQGMSDDEIAEERKELEEALDPSILDFLKHRASNIETLSDHHSDRSTRTDPAQVSRGTELRASALAADHEEQIKDKDSLSGVHFPKPPQPRDIDANSDTFLDDLHEKYFPSLVAEPEKLAWMKSTEDASYAPDLETVHLANMRFDFRGCIVPPRTAAHIPVTKGLHHHGDAPESAGYTVPELAHLARSTVPMQRCMAYQTLGRILFRLGTGNFGDPISTVPQAIRQMTDECRVLEILRAEANKPNSHLSAKNYATEALWLWQRAGGRSFKAA